MGLLGRKGKGAEGKVERPGADHGAGSEVWGKEKRADRVFLGFFSAVLVGCEGKGPKCSGRSYKEIQATG